MRESFVILAVTLRGLAIRFHFAGEIAQGSLGVRAMLAVLVPVVRPKGEKNADSDQRDFDDQVEERPSMFSPRKLMRENMAAYQRALQASS